MGNFGAPRQSGDGVKFKGSGGLKDSRLGIPKWERAHEEGLVEAKEDGGRRGKWLVSNAVEVGEDLANRLLLGSVGRDPQTELKEQTKKPMINLNEIKITPRDQQVLRLLVLGCSNKEIASQLSISPRTVKQHLRTLFLRAGIKEGRKRVKLATAMFIKEQVQPCSPAIG